MKSLGEATHRGRSMHTPGKDSDRRPRLSFYLPSESFAAVYHECWEISSQMNNRVSSWLYCIAFGEAVFFVSRTLHCPSDPSTFAAMGDSISPYPWKPHTYTHTHTQTYRQSMSLFGRPNIANDHICGERYRKLLGRNLGRAKSFSHGVTLSWLTLPAVVLLVVVPVFPAPPSQ